jgi:hypothetical protein
MNDKNSPATSTSRLKIITPGDPPPCLKPGFGFCRGCFGWQNMIDAALSGDPVWSRSLIHCSETDLAVKIKT